jgi:hypothetical protein
VSVVGRAAPSRRAAKALAAACLLAASAAGCAPPTGDFGRPHQNVIHDAVMPAVGGALARQRGEPVSGYRLTDGEREMRDLAWAIVMPPLDAQWRERSLVELRRTRILPANRVRLSKRSYVEALLATPYRSSVARYDRLLEDVEADNQRIEPFFQSAAKVAVDDRARARAIEHAPEVRQDERANALSRIDENALLIAWVRQSFDERLAAYRYALDRLMLETPDRASIKVAQAIETLARVLASLEPLGLPRGVFKG